jgi:hypothetical protein
VRKCMCIEITTKPTGESTGETYRAPECQLSWLPYRFLTVPMGKESGAATGRFARVSVYFFFFLSFLTFLPPGCFSPKTRRRTLRKRPGKKGKEGKNVRRPSSCSAFSQTRRPAVTGRAVCARPMCQPRSRPGRSPCRCVEGVSRCCRLYGLITR